MEGGLEGLVDFHVEINALKNTIRYRSCMESMRESTAGHSWKVAFLALDTINELKLGVDPVYSLKLALVHDLCECGMEFDVDSFSVANGKYSKKEKEEMEHEAMGRLVEKHGRQDVYNAWMDYEERRTPEAKFIKAMDKMEAMIHILERGDRGRNGEDGDHMVLYADEAVLAFPAVRPLLRTVKGRLREFLEKEGMEWKAEYDVV
jgi:putative hydrolases of HD superfamily